ncbi:MAG: Ca-activated chloride channel [Blastocatellia bacterium]|nr:Ca-activated chloride channel [Blastocatellia bacterium]
MTYRLSLVCIAIIFALSLAFVAQAQTGAEPQKKNEKKTETKKSETKPAPAAEQDQESEPVNPQDIETVKVNTNLVTVPVIASDREGDYVPDLRKEEFTIFEDGVKQELSFFATIDEPFHVVLMIDTSASTQVKLRQIQHAAIEFTSELQPADRLKVISFDDTVRDLCDFSNDRLLLQTAIQRTKPGQGTKLYDAVRLALDALRPIKGRKAIVIFTDGVDWHSDEASYEENRRVIEEAGVIVYPIRYDTRMETERMAREQARNGQVPQIPDPGGIFGKGGGRRGTTPPTFPGGGPSQIPGGGSGGTMSLPLPTVIVRRRDPSERDDPSVDPAPRPRRTDDPNYPQARSDGRDADSSYPAGRPNDSLTAVLDAAYKVADDYLNDIAASSGGKVTRADTLSSLPAAFSEIASELRTQYSLGYYPTNAAQDGKYHKIQVKSARKGVVLRARPGYRAPDASKPPRRRR